MTSQATAPAATASAIILGIQRLSDDRCFTFMKVIPGSDPFVSCLLRSVASLLVRHQRGDVELRRRAGTEAGGERDIAAVGARDPPRQREAKTDAAGLARAATVG